MSVPFAVSLRWLVLIGVLSCFSLLPAAAEEASDGAEQMVVGEAQTDRDEETGDSYQQRILQMQDWLRQRRLQRQNGWARDLVSPEAQGGAGDEVETADEANGGLNYFSRHALDERGYRRLDGNLRVRLRNSAESTSSRLGGRRQGEGKRKPGLSQSVRASAASPARTPWRHRQMLNARTPRDVRGTHARPPLAKQSRAPGARATTSPKSPATRAKPARGRGH